MSDEKKKSPETGSQPIVRPSSPERIEKRDYTGGIAGHDFPSIVDSVATPQRPKPKG